jgi:hypothetical protein
LLEYQQDFERAAGYLRWSQHIAGRIKASFWPSTVTDPRSKSVYYVCRPTGFPRRYATPMGVHRKRFEFCPTAMMASVVAGWLVASQSKRRRSAGFWWFMASNVLWIAWGWHAEARALIALQIALAILNMRGVRKNDAQS